MRRDIVRLAVGVAALGGVLAMAPGSPAAAPSLVAGDGIQSLPIAAQGAISAALARDRAAERVFGPTAGSPARQLRGDPFNQQGELSPRRGARGEEFGESVAISGATIVVGTPNYVVGATNAEQGAAYVFTRGAAGWADPRQVAVLKAPAGQPEELFGHSVAIAGNTIVVGAPFREVGKHTGQGAAYVFVKRRSGWRNAAPTAKLTAARGAPHEFFGEAVAVSGSTVICGAPSRAVGRNAMQGALDVFSRPASGWAGSLTPTARLTASDGGAHDALGLSVAIAGNTIVAGADLHAVATSAGQGAAYVFVKRASGWRAATQTAELTSENGQAGELLGHSVAISGATVVAGAPYRTVGESPAQGALDVFTRPASGWAGSLTDRAELTDADGAEHEALGRTLASSGSMIVAGADLREVGDNAEQGVAYVFDRPPSGWASATQSDELVASNGAAGDDFGRSVAIAGNTILAGAPDHQVANNPGQGAVYAFAVAPGGGGH